MAPHETSRYKEKSAPDGFIVNYKKL